MNVDVLKSCKRYIILCIKWCFPIILCSLFLVFRSCVPFRLFLVRSLCYVPFIRVYCSLCLTSGLPHFSIPSEYLQIFLGTSDTGILPDTVVICHDTP
jgi:hypothetical protein